jgi:hypothetical protein
VVRTDALWGFCPAWLFLASATDMSMSMSKLSEGADLACDTSMGIPVISLQMLFMNLPQIFESSFCTRSKIIVLVTPPQGWVIRALIVYATALDLPELASRFFGMRQLFDDPTVLFSTRLYLEIMQIL